MVVVNRQPAHIATRASMPFAGSADGTAAALAVQKCLVLLRRATKPMELQLMLFQRQTITAGILAVRDKGGKLLRRQFAAALLTHSLTVRDKLMAGFVKSLPDQVGPNHTEVAPAPPGHFVDRQAAPEQFGYTIHWHYLKGKQ